MDTLVDEKMNEQIKAQWVAALRSGDYPQRGGRLRRDDSFCCLGVLCDLAEKAGAAGRTDVDNMSSTYWTGQGADANAAELPTGVAAWAGLTGVHATNPLVCLRGAYAQLSELNDGGTPFATLATVIEEQL